MVIELLLDFILKESKGKPWIKGFAVLLQCFRHSYVTICRKKALTLGFYFNRIINTDPTNMITEPISFFFMFCSLKKRYPKKTLTMTES